MSAGHVIGRRATVLLPTAARVLLGLFDGLEVGTLTVRAPDGRTTVHGGHRAGPAADLQIADWSVADSVLRAAEIGLAEAYRDRRIETSDLTALLELFTRNARALEAAFYARPLLALYYRAKHALRANTRRGAARNIQAHYDLSNAFYALWLDESMTYSSAVFDAATDTPGADDTGAALAQGQRAKYERILRAIAPRAGQHVLEIGCGWGGFAEYAARTRGLRVTGITLSSAQLAHARARIARAGVASLVDLQLVDYRDVRGRFDHVVSIEMFEAVGERYWSTYFDTLRARLASGGRAVVQAITIDEAVFARYRRSSDFIREFIFPGGMLAPLPRIVAEADRAGLRAAEPFCFGRDYAMTLHQWQRRFDRATDRIAALGFDERFRRLWRFYLSYCEAGFLARRIDVAQLVLEHAA